MTQHLRYQFVPLVPRAGAAVQIGNVFRLLSAQARAQQVGKQVVVAIPLAPVVQRHEEQVGLLQML